MRMRDYLQDPAEGRISSKSFLWFGLLIPSLLLGLIAVHASSGRVLASYASSSSRAVGNHVSGAGLRANSVDRSRVLRMQRPIGFEPNRGQTIQRFKFLGRGDGYNLFIGEREAVLTLDDSVARPGPGVRGAALRHFKAREPRSLRKVIGIRLLGSRPGATIEAQDQLPGHVNYLVGNDSRRWHTGIPIYGRVLERGVWPGVDLAYYGNQRRIECDFIVAPHASPNAIELGLVNAGRLGIDADGNLLIGTGGQKLRLLRPVVYQGQGAARREIAGRYVLSEKSRVRFEVAAYDHERPLVIDPAVTLA